ncbi:MAG: sugar transferase, partial [Bacteroidetes bacterium]|nr:sugar transferase [Bacteroidota bacterium]
KINLKFSPTTLLFEFVLLLWIVIYAFFYKYIHRYPFQYETAFLSFLFFSWFISGLITHQFESVFGKSNYWRFIWSHIKSYVVFASLISFFVFLTNIPHETSKLIFFVILLYSFWAFIGTTIIFYYNRPLFIDDVRRKLFKATELDDSGKSNEVEEITNGDPHQSPNVNDYNQILSEQLQNVYLKNFSEIYAFINESLRLNTFDAKKCIMLRSADYYNVEVLPKNYLELYMNLHDMNDIRRINQYFILVNERLINGGFFIGKIEPIRLRYKRFHKKYPFYIAKFFYFVDFIWRRILPKLPVFQQFYFMITKGKNRAISMAEGLGRLYYCGYEIIATREIDNFLHFIARKVKEPSTDLNPSYGPLFKMRRLGKDGKIIYVYKMRTMHPYAEYLQKFIYERYDLKDGGKFDNDFRITSWGKVLRKLWLDEFPMFINFFKGDLKLVGVRPLSKQYLSLYDDELAAMRLQYKPGLVPPFYVDMPKTLEEIQQSERKYLEQYSKSPIITDIRYFFAAWYNILIKKARSG